MEATMTDDEMGTAARAAVPATMTMEDALAELAAVKAIARVWTPYVGARQTIYVNGPARSTIARIWVSSAGHVTAAAVWRAIYLHVTNAWNA